MIPRALSHILKATTAKFRVIVRIWDSLPHAKFCKKKAFKGIYPFGENLYQRLPISAILQAVSPAAITT